MSATSDEKKLEMALDEIADAAAQKRACVLAPSQARLLHVFIEKLRRLSEDA